MVLPKWQVRAVKECGTKRSSSCIACSAAVGCLVLVVVLVTPQSTMESAAAAAVFPGYQLDVSGWKDAANMLGLCCCSSSAAAAAVVVTQGYELAVNVWEDAAGMLGLT
jgi:hypothetical protein